ncbi:MAG TPA: virulence factor SrfB [Reyranella sp.]|nr:virulence factor SrfB [Reyranella sp.]
MSNLARLPSYPSPTTLIARSGIQFLDFGFDPTKLRVREWGFHDAATAHAVDDLVQLDFDEGRGQYEVVENGRRRAAEPNLVVTAKDAMAPFLDKWVPVPFLQMRPNNQFREGPADWARLRVVDLEQRYGEGFRDEQGFRYRAVLAFDTGLIAEAEGRAYLAPSSKDVTAGALFGLAPQQRANHWLLRQGWMNQWLEELFREVYPRATPEEIDNDIKQKPQESTARYLAFLGLLADVIHFPPIKLVGDAERPGRGAIEVDLVLDVGNSRTCGLLIEAAGELGINLNDSYELALRDLSHPECVHTRPFESRVEFAQAWFGKNHLSRLCGRADAFVWPTMTRVGPEATRLASRRRGTEGNTGMSSPKRYLWDEEAQAREWRFNVAYAQDQTAMPAAAGPMAQLINQKGEPLHLVEPEADSADHLPVFEPLYSRSSIMTFSLTEVLLQALTLMNSPQQRGRRAHAETPRRLRRIVLTLPTGMPLAERLIFRKRAEAARDLVWMMLGWKLDDAAAPAPRVLTDWDEASCTQLVYLYTEVARNFGGDARQFFQVAGKRRGQPADGTLSIASIDVGGGTTDLIINKYGLEGAGTSVTLFPEQRFREGFNVAGDDILLRVVQGHVLPPIETALRSAGIANPADLMAELVGGDRGGEDVIQRNLRQQFALQIAQPIALEFLRAAEAYDPTSGVIAAEPRGYETFFPGGAKPSQEVVAFVNDAARKRGAKDFDLKSTIFPVDLPGLDKTVRAEMARVLAPLAEIVHAYDCDILLLSGRPSRLPGIRALVMELLPLPPERVIALHEYRVGAWYPFRDARLRVEDPKTTVAVGAMIAALAQSQLPDFSFRSDLLRSKSIAKYIGKLDGGGRLQREDLVYSDVDLDNREYELPEVSFDFRGPMWLGARQLDLVRWPAARLYALEFARPEYAERHARETPFKIALARVKPKDKDSGDVERFRLRQVTNRDGRAVALDRLTLRLQTLPRREGYWLDTGMLKTG